MYSVENKTPVSNVPRPHECVAKVEVHQARPNVHENSVEVTCTGVGSATRGVEAPDFEPNRSMNRLAGINYSNRRQVDGAWQNQDEKWIIFKMVEVLNFR